MTSPSPRVIWFRPGQARYHLTMAEDRKKLEVEASVDTKRMPAIKDNHAYYVFNETDGRIYHIITYDDMYDQEDPELKLNLGNSFLPKSQPLAPKGADDFSYLELHEFGMMQASPGVLQFLPDKVMRELNKRIGRK